MNVTKPQFLIAATSSGCGKTTFTLGLLRALKRRGYNMSSFKCGPDYIDPKFHQLACGHESINLDQYMMSREHIKEVYARYSDRADCVIVEGVMGLFDGLDRMRGSSAELAELLDIPIILLVNAASTAYSVGATIYGFAHWKPNINVAGVIFNRVASINHYQYLCDAARDAGVPVLGYIPKCNSVEVPSRHLGLSIEELDRYQALPDTVADLVDKYIDVEELLRLCTVASPSQASTLSCPKVRESHRKRVAVARDHAFNFIYSENIRAIEQVAEVQFFSPLSDSVLPPCDLLYLPGGYPEFYLETLTKNRDIREQIKLFAENGGAVLAECGGMMYLCEKIYNESGQGYEMCGVLPQSATMERKKLTLGYREVRLNGLTLRGHEFHYSSIKNEENSGAIDNIAQQFNVRGEQVPTLLYRKGNVIAGYTHLYWGELDLCQIWNELF